MRTTPVNYRPYVAVGMALMAMGGPLLGMGLVGLTGPTYVHLLEGITPPLLAFGLIIVGGAAVGLALLPSFFLGAVCGYLLPGAWPYIAAAPGLGWATVLGLGLGRLFTANFLEVLLKRKAAWWATYHRLVHTAGAFLPTTIALLRLSPHMPFALSNLVCARLPLAPTRIWLYSYVGLLPRTLLAAYIGSQLQNWRDLLDRERPPWELLLSFALLVLLVYSTRRVARQFGSERH
jgi:uncharacterized membrane protein YdjX (TVP38/TMEM64 family)